MATGDRPAVAESGRAPRTSASPRFHCGDSARGPKRHSSKQLSSGKGRRVAMAGDGITRRPRARAGRCLEIAMGAPARNIAMESSGVTFGERGFRGNPAGPENSAAPTAVETSGKNLFPFAFFAYNHRRNPDKPPAFSTRTLGFSLSPIFACRRDEPQFGFRHRQRPASAPLTRSNTNMSHPLRGIRYEVWAVEVAHVDLTALNDFNDVNGS